MFNLLKTYLRSLPKTKKGQAMVEYALIIALIAILLIGALTFMKNQLANVFNSIGNAI